MPCKPNSQNIQVMQQGKPRHATRTTTREPAFISHNPLGHQLAIWWQEWEQGFEHLPLSVWLSLAQEILSVQTSKMTQKRGEPQLTCPTLMVAKSLLAKVFAFSA